MKIFLVRNQFLIKTNSLFFPIKTERKKIVMKSNSTKNVATYMETLLNLEKNSPKEYS